LQKRNFNELTVRNTNKRSLSGFYDGDPRLTLPILEIEFVHVQRNLLGRFS